MCSSMEKCVFDLPIKNEEKAYETIVEIEKNIDYAQVIYWIMSTFQTLQTNCDRFK